MVAWAAILAGGVWACVPPNNIHGIVFTSDEPMHSEVIEQFGDVDVNYFKDDDAEHVGYRYRSHYDSDAMVYVGSYELSFSPGVYVTCLGVVVPDSLLPDSINAQYDNIPIDVFDFNAALITEVEWLEEEGAIELTDAQATAIAGALAQGRNGGTQYWTHADTSLPYNMWYEQDTVRGVWGDYGVRSINQLGCCAIAVEVGLPPFPLEAASSADAAAVGQSHGLRAISVRMEGRGLVVRLAEPVRVGGVVSLINAAGVTVARFGIRAGARQATISRDRLPEAAGRYVVGLDIGGQAVKRMITIGR